MTVLIINEKKEKVKMVDDKLIQELDKPRVVISLERYNKMVQALEHVAGELRKGKIRTFTEEFLLTEIEEVLNESV